MASDSDEDILGYEATLKTLKRAEEEVATDKIGANKKKKTEVINLDSDEDDEVTEDDSKLSLSFNGEIALSEQDYEDIVKVRFCSDPVVKIHRFNFQRGEMLRPIFLQLARIRNVSIFEIDLFTESGIKISPLDSLQYINYMQMQTLIAYVRGIDAFPELPTDPPKECLKVKCKLPDIRSQDLVFYCLPNQRLDSIIESCSRVLKCGSDEFKLIFDGEAVKPFNSLKDLDFETGDTMEVHMKKSQ